MNDYIKKQIADIDLKIAEAQKLLEDPSVAQLAQAEIEELTKQKAILLSANSSTSEVKTPYTSEVSLGKSIILEIRSAAGGLLISLGVILIEHKRHQHPLYQ